MQTAKHCHNWYRTILLLWTVHWEDRYHKITFHINYTVLNSPSKLAHLPSFLQFIRQWALFLFFCGLDLEVQIWNNCCSCLAQNEVIKHQLFTLISSYLLHTASHWRECCPAWDLQPGTKQYRIISFLSLDVLNFKSFVTKKLSISLYIKKRTTDNAAHNNHENSVTIIINNSKQCVPFEPGAQFMPFCQLWFLLLHAY